MYNANKRPNFVGNQIDCNSLLKVAITFHPDHLTLSYFQENKLDLAEGILTGAKKAGSNKLTIQEMKQLFDLA